MNGITEIRTLVGTLTVTREDETYRRSFETACNYELHQVLPGTYEITTDGRGDVRCVQDALLTESYFVNSLMGLSKAAPGNFRDGTEPSQVHRFAYGFQLVAAVDEGATLWGGTVTLADGVRVGDWHYEYPAGQVNSLRSLLRDDGSRVL